MTPEDEPQSAPPQDAESISQPQAEQPAPTEPVPPQDAESISQPQAEQPEPTEPAPPPVKPERIWPVWLAYAIVLVGTLLLGIGMFVVWLTRDLAGGAEFEPSQMLPRYLGFLFSTVGMSLAGASSAVIVLTTTLVAAKLDGGHIRERLSLGWGRATKPQVLGAVAAMLGTSIALGALIEIVNFGGLSTLQGFAAAATSASPTGLVLFALLVSLVGALEELFFRGLMQRPLVRRWGRWGGILATAAAFAFLHMDLAQGFGAFFMGVLLGWIAERAGGIAAVIVAHAAMNAFATLSVPAFVAVGDFDQVSQLAFGLAVALPSIVWLRRSFARAEVLAPAVE